ncbi:MAG: hypothetical protein K2K37_10430 [Muribaculaceae bacterium]|nr:hypothetical protein [Muribaculaceae bacterium]
MHRLLSIIICIFSLSILNIGKKKVAEQTLEKIFKTNTKISRSSSPCISKGEVRDTSFSLPLKALDDPVAFMSMITDIQMQNRERRDTFNYSDKLLFGDSILGNICKTVIDSKKDPVYLLERKSYGGEVLYYDLSVRDRKKSAFTTYNLIGDKMNVDQHSVHESLQKIIYNWDKDSLLNIKEKTDRTVTDVPLHYGCATRLRCDCDSVYVDMVKFYMWPFDYPYYLNEYFEYDDIEEENFNRMDTHSLTK